MGKHGQRVLSPDTMQHVCFLPPPPQNRSNLRRSVQRKIRHAKLLTKKEKQMKNNVSEFLILISDLF